MKTLVLLFTVTVFSYASASCHCNGEELFIEDDESQLITERDEIYINESYKVFGKELNENDRVFIYENGVISFGENFTNQIPSSIEAGFISPLLLAGFWTNISTSTSATTSVSYRQLLESDESFEPAKSKVMCLLNKGFTATLASRETFNPTNIFVVTWNNMMYCDSETATFQIVLVSNSATSKTFALLLYKSVGDNSCSSTIEIGINQGDSDGSDTFFKNDIDFSSLIYGSNVGRRGAYAYDITEPDNTGSIKEANELTLRFVDDTPSVSKSEVEARFVLGGSYTELKEHLGVECQISNKHIKYMKTENCIPQGSEGIIKLENLQATLGPYILRITVYYEDTCIVTLEGKFRVYGNQEDYYCGVHFTNYGTDVVTSNISFVSMGATRTFTVIFDGENIQYPDTSIKLCREEDRSVGDFKCWKLFCEIDWDDIKSKVNVNSKKSHKLKVIPNTYRDSDDCDICEYKESRIAIQYEFY